MSIIDVETVITATAALVFVAGLGALMGCLLSLTTLSPLIIGGIIAAIPAVLFAAYCNFRKGELNSQTILGSISFCAISIGIGVGIGAIANANFPGIMLEPRSAALAGLAIGCIALFSGLFTEVFIVEPIANKANEYILSPAIKKVKERFSSKENQPDMPG